MSLTFSLDATHKLQRQVDGKYNTMLQIVHKNWMLCVEWGSTNTGWHINVYHVKNLHTYEV